MAALADDRVVTVGQGRGELVQVGGFGRGGQLGVGGVLTGVAEVVGQAGVEQEGVLEHHADLPADRFQGEGPQVVPVDQDPPGRPSQARAGPRSCLNSPMLAAGVRAAVVFRAEEAAALQGIEQGKGRPEDRGGDDEQHDDRDHDADWGAGVGQCH